MEYSIVVHNGGNGVKGNTASENEVCGREEQGDPNDEESIILYSHSKLFLTLKL